MLNMLVIEDNFYYFKSLINKIITDNKEIRLHSIATTGKEALEIIKDCNNDIDIILLDLKLPEYSGLDILKYIEKNNLNKYYKSIIVISGEMDLLNKVIKNKFLYAYISKTKGLDYILSIINELGNVKEYDKFPLELKIKKKLLDLHYNFTYVGTTYILEAILILCNENCNEKIKLEKNVYPLIAKKYNTTVNNIKTNIINSTKEMYYDCHEEKLHKHLGIFYGEKPKPKTVIYTIAESLKDYENTVFYN